MIDFEVTAYLEGGWWVVRAEDIGEVVHVRTLRSVEWAAREVYADHLHAPVEEVGVAVTVYLTRSGDVVRARWCASDGIAMGRCMRDTAPRP